MDGFRYLVKFYYIGSKEYHGSQRQQNLLTVEESLISSLREGNYIKTIKDSGFEVASRTDKFVSARASAFSFITKKKPILMEINSFLPKTIGVWAIASVPLDFLSRFKAEYRHYKYLLLNSNEQEQIDIKLMRKACKSFEGRHDFINFSKIETKEEKTVRDMLSATLTIDDDFIVFDFKSRAFIRQQIRRMVKKLLELGRGEISYDDFLSLFDSSIYQSYQPADASGLILWNIDYGENVIFTSDEKSVKRMKDFFFSQEQRSKLQQKLFKSLQHYDSR